ncbi:hypothetical protein LTR95_013513 [Oleoguttula sp. CCFEE 5521]
MQPIPWPPDLLRKLPLPLSSIFTLITISAIFLSPALSSVVHGHRAPCALRALNVTWTTIDRRNHKRCSPTSVTIIVYWHTDSDPRFGRRQRSQQELQFEHLIEPASSGDELGFSVIRVDDGTFSPTIKPRSRSRRSNRRSLWSTATLLATSNQRRFSTSTGRSDTTENSATPHRSGSNVWLGASSPVPSIPDEPEDLSTLDARLAGFTDAARDQLDAQTTSIGAVCYDVRGLREQVNDLRGQLRDAHATIRSLRTKQKITDRRLDALEQKQPSVFGAGVTRNCKPSNNLDEFPTSGFLGPGGGALH